MMTTKCLNLLLAALLISTHTCNALYLQFGEADFSLREDRSPLEAIFVSRGQFDGNFTVEVIPMTVSQFLSQGLSPVPDAISDLDHAEAGADFNDTVLTFTLEGPSPLIEETAFVEIFDDDISEYEEVFLLVLRVVDAPEGLEINMDRNVSVARIRQDSDSVRTTVGFNTGTLEVSEGAGQLNDSLFIIIEGTAEPTLVVQLSVNKEGIIRLLEPIISIPSGVTRVPVPLEVIDDGVVEDILDEVRIDLTQASSEQQSLFAIGNLGAVTVGITDDDRPHFGFEVILPVPGDSTDSALELYEGTTAIVCVLLIEPEEFKTIAEIIVQMSPESAASQLTVAGLPANGYFFSINELTFCFNLTANEDNKLSEPTQVTFSLEPQSVFVLPGEVERIDTDVLEIIIRDNDGVPKPPSDVELQLTNKDEDLLVTWKAEPSPLQPVSQFRISVRTTDIPSRTNNVGQSKRQANGDSGETGEYVTTDTKLLLEDVESEKMYTIQVCAENDVGHACAEPKDFEIKKEVGKEPVLLVSSGGLQPSNKSWPFPKQYIVLIIILPIILVLAVCILLISIIVCSCCCRQNSKNYYPSQQEKKLGKQAEAERYRARLSSSESITSSTCSASDFTPV